LPHDAFFYYYMAQLQAVRSGRRKLYLPLERRLISLGGKTRRAAAELYDLDADIGETTNVADKRPDVVRRLTALAAEARNDLGDLGRPGKGQRAAAFVKDPVPQTLRSGP